VLNLSSNIEFWGYIITVIYLPETLYWCDLFVSYDKNELFLQNYYQPKMYEGVSKSLRTGRLERQLQMVQLFSTVCSCIAML